MQSLRLVLRNESILRWAPFFDISRDFFTPRLRNRIGVSLTRGEGELPFRSNALNPDVQLTLTIPNFFHSPLLQHGKGA